MVAVFHVTGLTGRRPAGVTFSLVDNPMLGTGPHLPLRMIKPHVAGTARFRFACLFLGELVPRMAGITG